MLVLREKLNASCCTSMYLVAKCAPPFQAGVIGDISSSAHPALIFSTSSRCCAAMRRCYACTCLVHVGSAVMTHQ